ncbi:MAG: hypothetical protein HY862_04915 [Chloroflexi bacterium]|nr:hypothetical protein [Chloroflexota bacterium]
MKKQPSRTYATNLSDDELILLDALYAGSIEFAGLLAENFREATELDYVHHFSYEELVQVVDGMVGRGVMDLLRMADDDEDEDIRVGLTGAGGGLWEQEREPDWQRYCVYFMGTEMDLDGNEVWFAEVQSPTFDTAAEFLEVAIESGLFPEVDLEQMEIQEYVGENLVGWRSFEVVLVLRVPCGAVEEDTPVDWDLYEEKRTWWTDLMEWGGLQA